VTGTDPSEHWLAAALVAGEPGCLALADSLFPDVEPAVLAAADFAPPAPFDVVIAAYDIKDSDDILGWPRGAHRVGRHDMPVLAAIRERFEKEKPLARVCASAPACTSPPRPPTSCARSRPAAPTSCSAPPTR
jgi:hypothetical protein